MRIVVLHVHIAKWPPLADLVCPFRAHPAPLAYEAAAGLG